MAKQTLVQDWMTPNPLTTSWNSTIFDAHKVMSDHDIRRLPVMDGDTLVGIVTLGDVRGAQPSEATSLSVWELNYLLSKLTVDRVMSHPVITVSPEAPIQEAAQLMLEHKIAGLPVISGGELVGIITESDIFRVLVETWEAEPSASPPGPDL